MFEGVTAYKSEDVEHYRKKGWWLGLTLGDIFDKATDLYPGKEALVDAERRYTFRQLRDRVDRMAVAFIQQGIRKGDRVMIQLPNRAEFICVYYAFQKIGAIPLVLVPRHNYHEISHLCKLIEARAWVLPWTYGKIKYEELIDDVKRDNPQLDKIFIDGPDAPKEMICLEEMLSDIDMGQYPSDYLSGFRPDPQDVCTIIPTGGTTGFPKAVPRVHECYINNAEYLARAYELNSLDTMLIMTPVGHNLAMVIGVVGCIFSCARTVLLDSAEPGDFCAVVEREKVTATALVPVLVSRILEYKDAGQYDLNTLRMVYAGGSHSPAELVKTLKSKLGCQYVNGFGMSEGPLTQTRLDDPDRVIENTIGRPCNPYEDFRILSEYGESLPAGKEGELAARGPGIFTGYLKADAENEKAFDRDGYFRTGDMARINPDGTVTITGRIKDIIIRGGENISAVEVEESVVTYPKIEQASAVGMPDKEMGERVCVYVKTTDGSPVELKDLVAFLKGNKVSVLRIPERIEHVEAFPLTKAEKIDKKILREDINNKLKAEGILS